MQADIAFCVLYGEADVELGRIAFTGDGAAAPCSPPDLLDEPARLRRIQFIDSRGDASPIVPLNVRPAAAAEPTAEEAFDAGLRFGAAVFDLAERTTDEQFRSVIAETFEGIAQELSERMEGPGPVS